MLSFIMSNPSFLQDLIQIHWLCRAMQCQLVIQQQVLTLIKMKGNRTQYLLSQVLVERLGTWQSSNNERKQFKIIFSTCRRYMMDSRSNQTVYKLTIQKWFRDIFKRGRIKIQTKLSMVSDLQLYMVENWTEKQWRRWSCWLDVRPTSCK